MSWFKVALPGLMVFICWAWLATWLEVGQALGSALPLVLGAGWLVQLKLGSSWLSWAKDGLEEIRVKGLLRQVLVAKKIFNKQIPRGYVKAKAKGKVVEAFIRVPVGAEASQIEALTEHYRDALQVYAVRVTETQPGLVKLAVYAEDVLAGGLVRPDNEGFERTDVTEPVKIGMNEVGQPAKVRLFSQTVLVGGSPGSGKSGTTWALISHAALDPRAVLVVLDLKPSGIETKPVHDRADYLALNPAEAKDVLGRVWDEIQDRNAKLAQLGLEKVPAGSDEFPPVVIFVDEAAELTRSGGADGKLALDSLTRIVAVGRASGVGVVIITQKPDSSVLPTALRDLLAQRLCLRVGNREQAKTILGEVSEGAEPWLIGVKQPGRGYLRGEDGSLQLVQGVYMNRAEVIEMGKKAQALHEAEGERYLLP
uniref:FtsK domain-containing protein n=1 Tax=uncultured prokaryote TaxID=198431 RepID=A0A0H5QGV6_9ZZZZ|nr:hypothetical protein [uncultured prokaryote]